MTWLVNLLRRWKNEVRCTEDRQSSADKNIQERRMYQSYILKIPQSIQLPKRIRKTRTHNPIQTKRSNKKPLLVQKRPEMA